MSADPIVRYAAGAVLVLAFLGAMLVVVHGYWLSTSYTPPSLLTGLIATGLGSAATLLGVHYTATRP